MRILIVPVAAILLAWSFNSCKSSSAPVPFCDTCLKDSLTFTNNNNPLRPYVYISAKNCRPDSIGWGAEEFGAGRKSSLDDLLGMSVTINKDQIRCVINDTAYAWLVFSDCSSGRGIQAKLPFNSNHKLNIRRSGINNFDPKFSIADGLIAYSDGGNIFIEELTTGKKATMTFGQELDIDFDAIHQTIDSVNITPQRAWAKVKIKDAWEEKEKNIVLK